MTVKFEDYLVNDFDTEANGNKAVGVEITVFIAGTREKAILVDDEGNQLNNPVTTADTGQYSFNLVAGIYDIVSDVGTDKEFKLYSNYEISGQSDTVEVKEYEPFSGTTVILPQISNYVSIEVDGVTLPPSYFEFSPPSNQVTLKSAVTEDNVVVARFSFIGSSVSQRNIKTPFDFGAVGDGITDDLAALTLFFNSVGDGLIPSGFTFFYNGKITVQNNDKLNVFGGGTLKPQFLDQECIEFVNCPNGKVKGIIFDLSLGDASPSTYSNAISINSQSAGFDFSFNTVTNAPVQAFATFANSTKSNHNTITNPGTKDITLPSGNKAGGAITHANCKDGEIVGNRIFGGISNLILVNSTDISTPCDNVKIIRNYISDNSTNSIRIQPEDAGLESSKNCLVHGNTIFNCSRDAIRVNGIGHIVTNNTCDSDENVLDLTNNLINSNFSKDCYFAGNKAKKAGSCVNFSYTQTAPYQMGNHTIIGNTAEECNYFCVAFSGIKNTNLTFSGNSSRSCVLAFYDLRDTENVSITNENHDTLTQAFAAGVNLRRGIGVIVSNCTLSRSTDSPIVFRDCTEAKALSNTISDTYGSGIVFSGTVGGQAIGNTVLNYGTGTAAQGVNITINPEESNAPSSNIVANGNYFKPFNTNSNGVGYQSCRDLIIRDNVGEDVNVVVSQIDPDPGFAPNNTDIIVKDNMQNGSLSSFKSSGVFRQSGSYTMTGTNETITISSVNFNNAIAAATGSTTAADGASAALRSTLISGTEIRLVRGAATASMAVDWQVLEVL